MAVLSKDDVIVDAQNGSFLKLGVPFWGPPNKDSGIRVYIGVPLFWETTKSCMTLVYI